MSDGFDPCECVWSHEMAMRRLLSLLRQSQDHCTDTECFTSLPEPNIQSGLPNDILMMTVLWTALAMLLFYIRPSSLRGDSKSSSGPESISQPSLNGNAYNK